MDKRVITSSTLIVGKSEVLESDLDGEIIALDMDQGQCYGFNSSASSIWRLLKAPTSASKICFDLANEFNIEKQQCEPAVLKLLNEMNDQGLISIVGAE